MRARAGRGRHARRPGDGPAAGPTTRCRAAPPRSALLLGALLLVGATGCAATPRPDLPARSPSPVQVQIPSGGIALAALGFRNGPSGAFSLPRTSVITTSVDQASGVTLVLGSPGPSELAAYLVRALPATGFVVTRSDPATATLQFTGFGWQGTFTGTGSTSAVVLRP